VGTAFALPESLLSKTLGVDAKSSKEEELLAQLTLEFEIQSRIASAALKLANDGAAPKSVRKQRKVSYQQSQRKLKEIETKLNALKYFGSKHRPQARKQPRPGGGEDQHDFGRPINLSPNPLGSRSSEDLRPGRSRLGVHPSTSAADLVDASRLPRSASPSSANSVAGDEDEVDFGVSPRSCPSSPKKRPLGGSAATAASLENSPHW